MSEIDPIQYGELRARVKNLEDTLEKVSDQMDELMAMANKSKGGLWVLIGVGGAIGGIITTAVDHVFRR